MDTLLSDAMKADLKARSYPAEPVNRGVPDSGPQRTTNPYGDSQGYFIRGQATGGTYAVHTAVDIPISAYSRGSDAFKLFYGVQENTDIFFKLAGAALGSSERRRR